MQNYGSGELRQMEMEKSVNGVWDGNHESLGVKFRSVGALEMCQRTGLAWVQCCGVKLMNFCYGC